MSCPQYQSLQREFPKTIQQLEHSFTPGLAESVTDAQGHNPAGYFLFQLRRAHRHAVSCHGEVRGCLAICDVQFAAEVRWHSQRKTQFRNLIPALGACWYNLVHERGERWRELSQSTLVHSDLPSLRVPQLPILIGEVLDAVTASQKQRVG